MSIATKSHQASATPLGSIPLITGLLIFCGALLFKLMKWPTGSMLLVIGCVITCLAVFIRTKADGGQRALLIVMRLTISAAVAYALFRLMYWPGATVIGASAFILGGASLVLWSMRARPWKSSMALLLVVLTGTVVLAATPVHQLYGYMNLDSPGAQRFRHSGCGQWYRYSWMLYNEGLHAKSLAMNDSAQALVIRHQQATGKDGAWLIAKLQHTREQIEARNWNTFVELAPK